MTNTREIQSRRVENPPVTPPKIKAKKRRKFETAGSRMSFAPLHPPVHLPVTVRLSVRSSAPPVRVRPGPPPPESASSHPRRPPPPARDRRRGRRVTLQGVARYAARPASLSKHPRAGSGGRTNPLRHRRLYTDAPSQAASHTRTAGLEDQSCPRPVAEPWRSDISERSCASSITVCGGFAPVRRSRCDG